MPEKHFDTVWESGIFYKLHGYGLVSDAWSILYYWNSTLIIIMLYIGMVTSLVRLQSIRVNDRVLLYHLCCMHTVYINNLHIKGELQYNICVV